MHRPISLVHSNYSSFPILHMSRKRERTKELSRGPTLSLTQIFLPCSSQSPPFLLLVDPYLTRYFTLLLNNDLKDSCGYPACPSAHSKRSSQAVTDERHHQEAATIVLFVSAQPTDQSTANSHRDFLEMNKN